MATAMRFISSTLSLALLAACGGADNPPETTGVTVDAGANGATGRDAETPEPEDATPPNEGNRGDPLVYVGDFTTGSAVPPHHMCEMPVGGGQGDNVSPPLEWSGGPDGTKSFALILFDTTYGMLHWVVWDIPATATSLPEAIAPGYDLSTPAGAHQVSATGHGYFGPCSSGAIAGTYEYRLHALGVDMLDLTESSSPADAQAAVEAASIETAVWAGSPE